MILTLQQAFGWNNATTNLVSNWVAPLVNSGTTLEQIVSDIKSQDSDNDVTVANNWLKYLFQTVKDKVENEIGNLTTDSDITDTISKMFDNDVTLDNENSLSNTILDYMVNQRASIQSLAQDCILETQRYITYFKPICESSSSSDSSS